ncbi:hypothetical protein CDD81_2963 [Ophiocordyceps australis]|uniref:Transcriptional regulatory protein DEP1 n=1 Tax=Ophiocordyceps australis TaxID=1399860 RepID=A0A2C5YJM8_9HYPO|nr:hypothetical protein CDD81_2963 [Ophiocordyceps australis]
MAAAASAHPARPLPGTAATDLEDSNASSPLSEVDYGDSNDADIEHMQLESRRLAGHDSGDEKRLPVHQDSDSALSDAASDVNSEVNDTEAETERLYDTPKNQRHRDVVIDEFNHGRVFERTPSKLRRTTRLDRVTNGTNPATDDDSSILSNRGQGNQSPTKSTNTNHSSMDGHVKSGFLQDRKRKRSPPINSPLSNPPRVKRTASVEADDTAIDQDVPMKDQETPSAADLHSGHQSGGEQEQKQKQQGQVDDEGEEEEEEEGEDEEEEEEEEASTHNAVRNIPRETRLNKKSARVSARRKGTSSDDVVGQVGGDARDEAPKPDLVVENEAGQLEQDVDVDADADADADADGEEEAELMARNLEEAERKEAAFRDWTHIEEMFGFFRERLYKDRLERLEEEERSLVADEPTHAEYLSMKKCIDDRLSKRLEEIDKEYEFRIKAHDQKAVAVRAQIWSQFFQAGARRSAHSLPDYGLLFPKDPAQRVRNAVAYNMEVSALAGLAKYEGFPAGPELRGSSTAEFEGDMAAVEHARRNANRQRHIGHHRHHHHHHHHHQRDEYHAPNFGRLGPAGEQFIKDTPWANPNHSAHRQHHQASTSSESGLSASAPQAVLALPQTVDGRATVDSQALDKSPAPQKQTALPPNCHGGQKRRPPDCNNFLVFSAA